MVEEIRVLCYGLRLTSNGDRQRSEHFSESKSKTRLRLPIDQLGS